MIVVFLGEQNEGKTLTMTARLYEAYLKGFDVYANYNLEFPHTKITPQLLKEWTKEKKQFNKAVFGIDEIYLLLDSRNAISRKSKIFSYFVLQTSKRDVNLFCTAQYLNTVEKRLRNNLKMFVNCNRNFWDAKNKKFVYVDSHVRILDPTLTKLLYIRNDYFIRTKDKDNLATIQRKTNYVKADKIFKLYNTKELIDFEDD